MLTFIQTFKILYNFLIASFISKRYFLYSMINLNFVFLICVNFILHDLLFITFHFKPKLPTYLAYIQCTKSSASVLICIEFIYKIFILQIRYTFYKLLSFFIIKIILNFIFNINMLPLQLFIYILLIHIADTRLKGHLKCKARNIKKIDVYIH